jgi:hypothetical protein
VLLLAASATSAKEAQELFNGQDLTGWDGDPRVWSVKDGAIVGHTTPDVALKNNTFLIWKGGDVGGFKLTLEYKLEGGNSGIQYRSKVVDPDQWIVAGYQADMDGDNKYTGILYDERGRGILTNRGEQVTIDADGSKAAKRVADSAELAKAIHTDDWNVYVVEARGGHLKHTINGKVMSETTDRDAKDREKSGILALQVHANLPAPMTVRFRNIKLEQIEPGEGKAKKAKGSAERKAKREARKAKKES